MQNSKKEAHADSPKAQKGATDSTGVVQGLAAERRLDPRSTTDTKMKDRLKSLAKPNDDAVSHSSDATLHSSDATDATTSNAFACAVPPTSDGEWAELQQSVLAAQVARVLSFLFFDM